MKRNFTFILMLLVSIVFVNAQPEPKYTEVSGILGLMLNSDGESEYGTIDINNGWVLGATIGKDIGENWQAEIFWNIARASTSHTDINDARTTFDMNYQNIHLGINRYFGYYDDFVPYAGISLGASVYNPVSGFHSATTKFSISPTLGIKMFPVPDKPKWGFKAQARLYMPMTFSGTELFCESGDCGTTDGFLIPVLHGEISGGVVFRMTGEK